MLAGMVAFGPLAGAITALGPAARAEAKPFIATLAMTTAMAAGMVVWMMYRGHHRRRAVVMAAVMYPPAIIAGLLEGSGTLDPLAAGLGSHLLMLTLMLVLMLTQADEYMHPPLRRRRLGKYLRRAGAVGVAFAVAIGIGTLGIARQVAAAYSPPPARASAALTPVTGAHDPAKPTAVIVLGTAGAEVGDVLGPFQTLSATGRINVYMVAAGRDPVPLTGGLDVVPDLTFEQLQDRMGPGGRPDAVVVPAMPDAGQTSNVPAVDWIRHQSARGAAILGICYGARIVADAGLLDGRPATSHWRRLGELRESHPNVRWQSGTRYVDDGGLITTAGVLSGIDGSLRIVERLLDPVAAADASRSIGWPYYSAGAPAALQPSAFAPADLIAGLNAGYRAARPTLGVLLTDGVGELELVSIFDTYGGQSFAVQTLAVGFDGPVRTRHSLTVVPRARLADAAPDIDRLLVPGTAAHYHRAALDQAIAPTGLTADYLHDQPGFPIEAGLRDIATNVDVPTAQWAAKMLEYPVDDLTLTGPGWPLAVTTLPVLMFAGVLGLFWMAPRAGRRLVAHRTQPNPTKGKQS